MALVDQLERTGRLYQQIAARLEHMIRDGTFPVGHRMPAERELARRLDVSRPSVREAIIALEVAGMVEVRTGSGVYVLQDRPSAPSYLSTQESVPGPYEMLQARRIVEGETCYLAAQSASVAQLEAIGATIEVMRTEARRPVARGDTGDREFHLIIAEASNNSALASFVRQLWDARNSPLWRQWLQRSRTSAAHLDRVEEHAEIHAILTRRDAEAARGAMWRHIDSVRERFLKDLD